MEKENKIVVDLTEVEEVGVAMCSTET